MKLQIFQGGGEVLTLMQTAWAKILEPLLKNALPKGLILEDVELDLGLNTIDHRLGRDLVGWIIVRQRSAADVYDEQDDNQFPDRTLKLYSSAPVSVDLYVF